MNKCPHGGIVNHCQFCLNAQDYKIVADLNADLQTEVDRLKSENERLQTRISKAVEIYDDETFNLEREDHMHSALLGEE